MAWAILVGLFAVAAVYILVAVPSSDTPTAAPSPSTSAHSDGLTETFDGYTLEPITLPTSRGAQSISFRILGPGGSPLNAYATVQDRPLHLYVAREDLSVFHHLHPRLVNDTWQAPVDVPDGGVYRIYAEFMPADRPPTATTTVLGTRFIISGDTRSVPVPAAEPTAAAGPYTVKRLDGTDRQPSGAASALRLQILDAEGQPVTKLQPYLGSFAHVSAFDVYTQALTHVHALAVPSGPAPPDGVVVFHAVWHHPGAQRVFVEFQVDGQVHQAVFTVVVA